MYTLPCAAFSSLMCINISSTHRVVGITTMSRKEHQTAQTRELACTKQVLPQVVERGRSYCFHKYSKVVIIMYTYTCTLNLYFTSSGLRVVEVAHDFQQQVKGYITDILELQNSFDTWHGTNCTHFKIYTYHSLINIQVQRTWPNK